MSRSLCVNLKYIIFELKFQKEFGDLKISVSRIQINEKMYLTQKLRNVMKVFGVHRLKNKQNTENDVP